jgi:tRNA pseudouridine55 synthase
VGPATRFLQYLPLEPKEYRSRFRFGIETSTYDIEGAVVAKNPLPLDLRQSVEAALPQFRGPIQQLPPMHSAVKVKGQPLYKYARHGEEVAREPRAVNIELFEVVDQGQDWLEMRIVCSGGTYIRSLAHDLGQVLGCGAHLAGLVRTRVGRFSLDDALPLAETGPKNLLPLSSALLPMPMVPLSDDQTHEIREGRPVMPSEMPSGALAALVDPDGAVFSVARVHGNLLQPECVIPAEAMHESTPS